MANLKSYVLAAGTLTCALGIGYVMQFGGSGQQQAAAPAAPLEVSDVELTSSSAVALPTLPSDTQMDAALSDAPVQMAAAAVDPEQTFLPDEEETAGFDCSVDITANAIAGAMVDLKINAPCQSSERVTIHHQGLMFTEIMQPDGTLQFAVPAMAERATFIVAFANGEGATVATDVSSIAFYDRVAVQWKGQAGLQLHAREFTDAYFEEGHVWAAEAGDLTNAATGLGGFLIRLGDETAPDALVAEVYSYPSGTSQRTGEILMTVEAEITNGNCDSVVEAQTLEIRDDQGLRVRDMSLEMPACEGIGDFLVLKNLVQDLKVAAR